MTILLSVLIRLACFGATLGLWYRLRTLLHMPGRDDE